MSREEFLRRLEESLSGEVPSSVIRENLNYYGSYISQEMGKGRTMDDIIEEIGEPNIVARTIIDSSEAAGETVDSDSEDGFGGYTADSRGYGQSTDTKIHYIDLNKWYWKVIILAVALVFFYIVFAILGGIFSLLFRFAGPILLILLLYWFLKSIR